MPPSIPVTQAECPHCAASLTPDEQGRARCSSCEWSGQVFNFIPPPRIVVHTESARPEDTACANHPTKRATATCAGSGDYICALCTVELQGKTFSAQYLESAGRQTIGKAFERYLDRPDRVMCQTSVLTLLFTGCGVIGPFLVPFSIYQFTRIKKLRKTDPFYASLISERHVMWLTVLLVISSLINLSFGLIVLIALLTR